MSAEARSNGGIKPHDHVAPLLVSASAIATALDRASLIEAIAAAFRGGCEASPRHHQTVPVPGEPDATMLIMPAWRVSDYLGVKLANVFPGNGSRGLSSIQASYLLLAREAQVTLRQSSSVLNPRVRSTAMVLPSARGSGEIAPRG